MNAGHLFVRARGVLRGRSRSAPHAHKSSDVAQELRAFVIAIGAVVALAGAIAFIPAPDGLASPGPIARPHAIAKLACSACHGTLSAPTKAATACTHCHAASAHQSTREGHRALLLRGSLRCVTCHRAHDAVASKLPALRIPLEACAGCHDLSNPRDPIARCRSADGLFSCCFDEHVTADPTRADFVAADIARRTSTRAKAPLLSPHTDVPFAWIAMALLGAGAGLALFHLRPVRDARLHAGAALVAPTATQKLPQIDPSTCLGCYACVDACPFDVLEIERYVAVVVRPSECCGVITCASVCPNESLTLREGAAIEQRPRVDAHLESIDAPGVFLAGDMTGLPLIKNAIHQGARVVDRIAATLPHEQRGAHSDDAVDIVVVGAGPAGLSAALRAKELGLSYVVLEQASVAASIRSFPRNKLVFDAPLDLPVVGALWLRESTKEELLAQWTRIVRTHRLAIREGHRVVDVTRAGALFAVAAESTSARTTVFASRIVIATGKRGTPRAAPFAIADEAAAKVSYALADARSFAGARVIVVGLGDSAMEAAIALSRQSGTRVAVVHRGADFTRGKARNIAELKSLVASGQVELLLGATIERVEAAEISIRVAGAPRRMSYDAVLVFVGGVASWDVAERAGVRKTAQIASLDAALATRVENEPSA